MADGSAIEWTDASWNPVRGCTRVSPGCGGPGPHGGCYAEGIAARFSGRGQAYEGLAEMRNGVARWTGRLARAPERVWTLPLAWTRPRRIFVNSMSDLFHEDMPEAWIDETFAIIAVAARHIFQVLTKRVARMQAYFAGPWWARVAYLLGGLAAAGRITWQQGAEAAQRLTDHEVLPNVWLGVSVEDQRRADERRQDLGALAAGGWRTFVSYEPALGPVDWTGWNFLRWLIAGGESGPRARAPHPDWFRAARDYCVPRGIPFFFKQWGEWGSGSINMDRVGKKAAGRLLDGRTWDEMPASAERHAEAA